jgi:hypothetical protein
MLFGYASYGHNRGSGNLLKTTKDIIKGCLFKHYNSIREVPAYAGMT